MTESLPNLPLPVYEIILPGYYSILRNALLLLVLFCIIYAIIYYYMRKREKVFIPEKVISKPENIKIEEQVTGLKAILDKYIKLQEYREGLHEVSEYMKTLIEKRTGFEIEEMTAEEMATAISDKTILDYFIKLEIIQFGKENPNKENLKWAVTKGLDIYHQKKIAVKEKKV